MALNEDKYNHLATGPNPSKAKESRLFDTWKRNGGRDQISMCDVIHGWPPPYLWLRGQSVDESVNNIFSVAVVGENEAKKNSQKSRFGYLPEKKVDVGCRAY